MSSTRRAAIYKLAAAAQESDLDVMSGILDQDEDGRWTIGFQDLSALLSARARPFLISLSRVATIIEISQSKNGFLRKQMNTMTNKNEYSGLNEPNKKSLITGRERK